MYVTFLALNQEQTQWYTALFPGTHLWNLEQLLQNSLSFLAVCITSWRSVYSGALFM